jgi:hypothetical protein
VQDSTEAMRGLFPAIAWLSNKGPIQRAQEANLPRARIKF